MDVVRTAPQGWIEVIVGSMFSGKSEELIRRVRRAQIARQRVQIFKPAVDTRFADDAIVSHGELRLSAEPAGSSADLLTKVRLDTEVVGIDEGQFFDAALPAACVELAERGVRVIVAGLDQDYLGRPFEPMPHLLAIAEYITKTRAICVVCGNPANHTQRLVHSADRVLLGAHGTYEARCRRCFDPLLSRQEPTGTVARGLTAPAGRSQNRLGAGRRAAAQGAVRARPGLPRRQPASGAGPVALGAAPLGGAGRLDRAQAAVLRHEPGDRRRPWAACCSRRCSCPRPLPAVFGELMMFVYYARGGAAQLADHARALRRRHLGRRRVHALRPDRRADLAGARRRRDPDRGVAADQPGPAPAGARPAAGRGAPACCGRRSPSTPSTSRAAPGCTWKGTTRGKTSRRLGSGSG